MQIKVCRAMYSPSRVFLVHWCTVAGSQPSCSFARRRLEAAHVSCDFTGLLYVKLVYFGEFVSFPLACGVVFFFFKVPPPPPPGRPPRGACFVFMTAACLKTELHCRARVTPARLPWWAHVARAPACAPRSRQRQVLLSTCTHN